MCVLNIHISEINPFVRYMEKRNSFTAYKNFVMAYDHRIFYVHQGKINADVSGVLYEINAMEFLIIPPAAGYKLSFSEDVIFTVINFDVLTENTTDFAREPKTEDEFDCSEIFSEVTCLEFPCMLSCTENTNQIISEMEKLYMTESSFKDMIISALLKLLIINGVAHRSSERRCPLVTEIIRYIDENYALAISNKMLGELFSYHPNYINKVFKENIGQSLHNYILNVRLEKSIEFIKDNSLTLGEVAQRCGFCSQAYFTKKFREKYKTTPYKFKNKMYL